MRIMTISRRRLRRLTAVGVLTGLALSFGGSAFAYWTTSGVGTGSATAGTLNAPTGVTIAAPTGSHSTLHASWTAPASGVTPTRYLVAAGGKSCTVDHPGTACTVEGLTADTTYSVQVSSLYKSSWTAPSPPQDRTTNRQATVLRITSANPANNGNTRMSFTGTGTPNASVTVTVCADATCTSTVGPSLTATVNASGSWTTNDTGGSLSDPPTSYYAKAAQTGPAATSTTVGPFRARTTTAF